GLIPSPRGAHSAVMRSGIMIVWGGYSGTTLSDADAHFYDFKANAWVDSKTASTVLASNNSTSNRPSLGIIIGVVIAGVIVIIGIISFFIMRKCRSRKVLDDCEVQNDPYIRPGGQLGSNLDLPTNDEDKKTQTKDMSTFEPITLESIPPPSTPLNKLQSQGEKEPKQSNPGSMVSTDLQFSPNMPLSKKQIKHMSTESQRIKRTHKRTSSVSLSRADLEIIRPRSFVYHKSSLSASSINSSTNRSSCAFDSIPSGNSESTSITSLDSPTSDKSNRCDSRATSRSVTSMQWVGFNSKMIDERDKERYSLHVRNASYRKSTISEDDGYVIRGDYINTAANFADRRSYSGDFMNYEDVTPTYDPQKRRSALRSSPGRSCISVIPEKEDFTEDVRTRGVVDGIISSGNDTREDSIVDKHANQTHYPSQNLDDSSESPVCNEDDEVGSRKSKRSSKRISRVSFALKDEKIEFDETESSKSVSFARVSGRTSSQGSESSSGTPSIIEEEEDGGFPNSVTPKASDLNLESLRLYKSEDEFDSIDTRFSLSMFDIGKDQSKTHDTASKVPAPPVERVESQEVRHSIKELMIDQGVLWALQDVE
ncbi:17774_t:CDS:1, partial [Acaulospora morrowiae]